MIVCNLRNGKTFGITTDMQGKMEGMLSLNTSAQINPFCQDMRKNPDSICKSCYSKVSESRFKHTHTAYVNNYHTLSENILKDSEIPVILSRVFRFHAHGELINRTHYKNLVAIAEANPNTVFALWTKNTAVIRKGGILLRDNLVHVYSTPELNVINPQLPKGFDRVFTVYSRPFVREHTDIVINCQNMCKACLKCYRKGGESRINELIKSSHARRAGE